MRLGVTIHFFGTHSSLHICQRLKLNIFMASHHHETPSYGLQPLDVADFPAFL